MRRLVGIALIAALGVFETGCSDEKADSGSASNGGAPGTSTAIGLRLGDPCIPSNENGGLTDLSATEVLLDMGTPECGEDLCLANHFQGRVTCPYGQTLDEAAEWETATDWSTRCSLPGTDGSDPGDRIQRAVQPQVIARPAADTVHCSCRCANDDGRTDDGDSYCTCPADLVCVHLVDDIGIDTPEPELSGSYCIKPGAEYDEYEAEVSPECEYDPSYPGGPEQSPNYCGPPKPY